MIRLMYCTEKGFNWFINLIPMNAVQIFTPFALDYGSGGVIAISEEGLSATTGMPVFEISKLYDQWVECGYLGELLGDKSSAEDRKRVIRKISSINYGCFSINGVYKLHGMII